MQPETAPAQTSMMTCANFTKSAEEPNLANWEIRQGLLG
jgi:hypothetical protein